MEAFNIHISGPQRQLDSRTRASTCRVMSQISTDSPPHHPQVYYLLASDPRIIQPPAMFHHHSSLRFPLGGEPSACFSFSAEIYSMVSAYWDVS